jgi:hypothetical protein
VLWYFLAFNGLNWEVIVRFVDIIGMFYHFCLIFRFVICKGFDHHCLTFRLNRIFNSTSTTISILPGVLNESLNILLWNHQTINLSILSVPDEGYSRTGRVH